MTRRTNNAARSAGGFTLLELLVAIAVFSVIAAAAYTGLDTATATEARIDDEGRKWKSLSFLFGHIERDLACFVDRPVSGPDGEKLRSITGAMADKSGVGVDIAFTRLGRGAEGAAPRRVAYRLNDGKIEALIWPALDLAPGAKPDIYEAMNGVSSFGVKFSAGGSWSSDWDAEQPPSAVEVTVALKSGETIRRVFTLR